MKTYIDNSKFIEFSSEIAGMMTEQKFGEKTYTKPTNTMTEYTEKAQDYFNKKYDEIQRMMNEILGIFDESQRESTKEDEVTTLYNIANGLMKDHINNGGMLDFSEKEYSYLSDDLDSIEIGYYLEKPDSDYQQELVNEQFVVTDDEAIAILTNRINHINEEIKANA